MSVMLKKKQAEENELYWKDSTSVASLKRKKKPKPDKNSKLRKRTTILPIFLKKMQEKTMKDKFDILGSNNYRNSQTETDSTKDDDDDEDEKVVDATHSKFNFKGSLKNFPIINN